MADDDSAMFYSSPPYDILMSRKGEKPWKPCPPKRSVSISRTDSVRAPTSDSTKKTSSNENDVVTAVEPVPAIVSVVLVDVSGRSYGRLRNQSKSQTSAEETLLNGSIASRVPSRYSTLMNSSSYDLYRAQEHGFAVKQSLNLRAKTPSKDRWIARTGMNLDPYSFEDEHRKTLSRGLGPKLEKFSGKTKPNASFLLCSSRKAIRSDRSKEPAQPYQMAPGERSPTSDAISQANAILILPSKRPKLSSEKRTREPSPFPQPPAREPDDKKKKPRPNSTDFAQSRIPVLSNPVARSVSDATNGYTRPPSSDHEPFFAAVAVPSGHSFWTTAKTRRSLPVSVPRLSNDDLRVDASSTRNPQRCWKGETGAFTVMRLDGANRAPCSVQVISETAGDAKFSRVSTSVSKVQAVSGRKIGNSYDVSKATYQPRYQYNLPSPLVLKEQEESYVSSLTNLGSQTKQSFPSISESNREAFDKVQQRGSMEARQVGLEKVDEAFQRLSVTSDFASDYDQMNLSFRAPDGASVRSSTISDWYSARDCHSSSICVDSLGSDPVSLDCASSKGSTTLFSRVKRAIVQSFGAVWTMFVPSLTRPRLARDSLSDVDSGCSFGTNVDLGALQRSPSEMSEIQKLAVLAEKIAADKDRSESAGQDSDGSSPCRRRLARAFSSELQTILARSASLTSARSGSKYAERQTHQSSYDSSCSVADEGWKTSYPSETCYSTLPLSRNRNSRDFKPPHNPSQQTCNYFSTMRPFVNSLKAQHGCGEIENKTIGTGGKSQNFTDARDSLLESNAKRNSQQFSAVENVMSGGKLSLPYKAPNFEISCNAEKQRVDTRSRSCTSKASADVKIPNTTAAGTALNDCRTETSFNASGGFTRIQPCTENFAKAQRIVEHCLNDQMNLRSSKVQTAIYSKTAIKNNSQISTFKEEHLSSGLSARNSDELSRESFNSGRSACPDEQPAFVQFSVSPELDQAIEMLAASSRRIGSDWSENCSTSCITTSTSKEASSKAINEVYVSPEDLQKMLEQRNLCSDICPKVKTSLETLAENNGQCLGSSLYCGTGSRREFSYKGAVLNPKSCSLNDSKIQTITDTQCRKAQLSQNTSTADSYAHFNKTNSQESYSHQKFGSSYIREEMSSAKRNSAAVLPKLSPNTENSYGKNHQMVQDFRSRGSKLNNSTAGLGKAPPTEFSNSAKPREQSIELQATTRVVPNMQNAGLTLGKASGKSAALNQSAQGSGNNFERKSAAVAASPSAQRTWASRVAFLTGESS